MEKEKSSMDNKKQFNLWQDILNEAMSKKDLDDANVFVFGNNASGKKNLIRVINKEIIKDLENTQKTLNIDEQSSKFGEIDYSYMNITKLSELDAESIGKMGVWFINELTGSDTFQSLVREDYLLKCVCLIVVDLSRPWEIIESLKKWSNFIYENLSQLKLKFPVEKQNELRDQSK